MSLKRICFISTIEGGGENPVIGFFVNPIIIGFKSSKNQPLIVKEFLDASGEWFQKGGYRFSFKFQGITLDKPASYEDLNCNSRTDTQKKVIGILSWAFPIIWCLLFVFIQLPVLMVLLGGMATSILLLIVIYGAIVFRYQKLPQSLAPSLGYDIYFWLSILSILAVSIYGIWQLVVR